MKQAASDMLGLLVAPLRVPSPFLEVGWERAFLDEFRSSARMFLLWALFLGAALSMFGFVRVWTGVSEHPWSNVTQISRLVATSVLLAGIYLLLFNWKWFLSNYVACVTVCIGAAVACLCVLIFWTAFYLGKIGRLESVAILVSWWVFGFARVPATVSLCINLAVIVVSVGAARFLEAVQSGAIAMYLFFAIFTGWILCNSVERRERRLFARARALDQARQELSDAVELARSESRLKSRLLSVIGHDLRQPIKSVGLYLAAIAVQTRPSDLSVSVQTSLRQANICVEAIESSVDHLVKLGRSELTNTPVHYTHVSAAELLNRIASVYEPIAAAGGVQLDIQLRPAYLNKEPTAMNLLSTDPDRLWDVLSNLVSNAIRYRHAGTDRVCRVIVRYSEKAGLAQIAVADNGIGIGKNELPFIFEPFWRGESVINRVDEDNVSDGLGLRLSVVKSCLADLRAHNLTVRSRPEIGTVFRVRVPYRVASARHKAAGAHS